MKSFRKKNSRLEHLNTEHLEAMKKHKTPQNSKKC